MPQMSRPLSRSALNGAEVLLLGSRGAGMTAVGEILSDCGSHVLRMDAAVPQGDDRELPCVPDALETVPALCVRSPAVLATDSVRQSLKSQGVPEYSLPEFLASFFRDHSFTAVAGTHGKSTTAAMLTWILHATGQNPASYVGARSLGSTSGRCPAESAVAIVESCEYRSGFLNFEPDLVVLTGVERDHPDWFATSDEEDAAYLRLCSNADGGTLVSSAACRRSQEIAAQLPSVVQRRWQVVESSADKHKADVTVFSVRPNGSLMHARVSAEQTSVDLTLQLPGRHNLRNAAAAITAALEHSVTLTDACEALAEFKGIERRLEFRGEYNGLLLIDDYAHHPTAVRATLETVRECWPDRRLICAFEPHQMSRMGLFFDEFAAALSMADEVYLLPVFAARENQTPLECCRASGSLVKQLNNAGTRSFLFANLDQIVSRIDHSARPSDVFLTMGAGRTNLIHDELTRRLQRNSVA